jgi:hypothetical protein
MPKAGKHQGQPDRSEKVTHDQGIVRDGQGQEQPSDKERAQRVSRQDRGGDPPGDKPQR